MTKNKEENKLIHIFDMTNAEHYIVKEEDLSKELLAWYTVDDNKRLKDTEFPCDGDGLWIVYPGEEPKLLNKIKVKTSIDLVFEEKSEND